MIDSQRQLIREALERGEVLTNIDMLKRFGSGRGQARIDELRKVMNIPRDQKVKLPNGKRIAIYFDGDRYSYEEAVRKRYPDNQGIPLRDEKGRFQRLKNPLNINTQRKLRELYEAGKPLTELYDMFPAIPHWRIYQTIRKSVEMRPPGQPKQAEFEYAESKV